MLDKLATAARASAEATVRKDRVREIGFADNPKTGIYIALTIIALLVLVMIAFVFIYYQPAHAAESEQEFAGTLNFQHNGSLVIDYSRRESDRIPAAAVWLTTNQRRALDKMPATVTKGETTIGPKKCVVFDIRVKELYDFILLSCD